MQKYKSNITTTSGAAVRNVPVHVLAEDGSPAAIFLDRAGTVPASNPLITAADGTFYFYAVNGRYSLRTTVDGATITDSDVVLLMDPAEITVAGPIAEAVAAAQAAATAAETAVANSGIPVLVSSAQNAVVDANAALAQAITSSNSAALSKTDADAARDAAVTAKMAAEAALDSFDDRYLGAKSVEPTTDNDGGALLPGALYWDTVIGAMRAWSGSVWVTLPAATKASVGLANVDNTSDANKPVSTAQAAAIAASTANNIHEAAAKITPADADELGLSDSAASWGLKKLTFANLKTWFASLFVSKSGDTMTGPLTVEGENYSDIMIRAYGNAGDGAVFHGNQALGTKAAPLPPTAGTPIFGIGARPWTGTQWTAHSTAAVHMFARENVSNTAQGTSFRIAVTPLGGTWNARINAVAFECDGVGQGARWRARFSGATQAERSFIQDNSGGPTTLGVLSGATSGSSAAVNCFSRNDPDNSPYVQLGANEANGVSRIYSGALGTAPALPLVFGAGASIAALTIDTSGKVLATSGALGYGVGTGGTAVQSPNNTSSVTLNKPNGIITLANGSISAGGKITFQLQNSLIGIDSTVIAHGMFDGVAPAIAQFTVQVEYVQGGIAYISVKNNGGTSVATDNVKIKFAVFAGSNS